MRTLFQPLAILLSLIACQSSVKESVHYPESGKVHQHQVCEAAPELSYALFLPENFRGDKGWPVIFFFDPHGSGSLPLMDYQSLANKYGYILIGSENSRNGLPYEEVDRIVNVLLTGVTDKYPIDTNRIYTAGFSGGSRVAGRAAMIRSDVRGVIGCGAGLPSGEQPPSYAFDYFGMAGTSDFNMGEMVQLDAALEQIGLRHFLLTYPGSHSWPPAGVMEEALLWHHFNAMREGKIPRELGIAKAFQDTLIKRTDVARSMKHDLREAELLQTAIAYLDQLTPVDVYRKRLAEVEKSDGYKKEVENRNNLLTREQQLQQMIVASLFSKDPAWWQSKIREYDRIIKNQQDPDEALMATRLKGYLSLICYSNVTAAMKQNQHELARNLVSIYTMADPDNPEPYYLTAVLNSQANDSIACFRNLDIAVSKGFSDKSRIMQQPEFEEYRNSQRFFDLTQKMK